MRHLSTAYSLAMCALGLKTRARQKNRPATCYDSKRGLFPSLTRFLCQGESGLFTVGAPATAKNIISVGAQQNARQSVPEVVMGEKVFLGVGVGPPPWAEQSVQALAAWADFGRKQAISGTLVLSSPDVQACTRVSASVVAGKVALVQVCWCPLFLFLCKKGAPFVMGLFSYRNRPLYLAGKVALVQVCCCPLFLFFLLPL